MVGGSPVGSIPTRVTVPVVWLAMGRKKMPNILPITSITFKLSEIRGGTFGSTAILIFFFKTWHLGTLELILEDKILKLSFLCFFSFVGDGKFRGWCVSGSLKKSPSAKN